MSVLGWTSSKSISEGTLPPFNFPLDRPHRTPTPLILKWVPQREVALCFAQMI